MRAALLNGYGGAEAFELAEINDPQPGADEVLIDVAACGLNPLDWKVRRGFLERVLPLELPAILGWDVAGTIAALGPEVTGWAIGDRVAAFLALGKPGAYAERTVAAASLLARVPEGMDLVQAAALPIPTLTAWQAVHEHGGLAPGQRLLVLGAAGGVGRVAASFARQVDDVQLFGVARDVNDPRLADTRFDRVVDANGIAGLEPPDLVIDTLGGEPAHSAAARVKAGGRLVTIVELGESLREAAPDADIRRMAVHPDPARLEAIMADVLAGRLSFPVTQVFPLDSVAEAHDVLEKKGAQGKFVLRVTG